MLVDRDKSFGAALFFTEEKDHGVDCMRDSMRPDFMLECGLAGMSSDWYRVIAIRRHVLGNRHLVSNPTKSNLREIYCRIVDSGAGYCGDFTHVFMAFSIAANIPMRVWAFFSYGFGGHNELIRHGQTSMLFKADSADALAHKFVGLLGAQAIWSAIRKAGRRFVEEERNWTRNISNYLAPYTSLSTFR